jgi:hypothetical protein
MANNVTSNVTNKLARVFLSEFENESIQSKNVNTQLLDGKFNPSSGDTTYFKRPHDYLSVRTSTGDVSGSNPSDIISGKIAGTVQDYFTAFVNYDEVEEALHLDQLDMILNPLATRIATDMELDFSSFMLKNAALYAGTIGQPAVTWDEVAEAAAVLRAAGVKTDAPWYYSVNPYTMVGLASNTRGIGAGGAAGSAILDAHKKATIMENFAGLTVMSSTTLGTVTTQAGADRAGTLSANPTVTYVAHKDTYTQTLAVTGFQANLVVKAGERITIAGRYMLNQSTRQPMIDATGAKVLFTAVVAADVTLNASGAGNVTINGPAIYEASGQYNTVDSAPVSGDVVTLLGSASTTYQPNLFWYKNSFGIGSVPIKKLYSTDTLATTKSGLQFRVSKYSDGDANKQKVRFDFHPAYAAFNPHQAGHGYGVA